MSPTLCPHGYTRHARCIHCNPPSLGRVVDRRDFTADHCRHDHEVSEAARHASPWRHRALLRAERDHPTAKPTKG